MLPQKQAEEAIVSNFSEVDGNETKEEGSKEEENQALFSVKNLLWHGGSAWDAWFSCASNQVIKKIITTHNQISNLKLLSNTCFVLKKFLQKSFSFWACHLFLNVIVFIFNITGCPSSFDTAIFVLSTGNALRNITSDILWTDWKLDCLFDQCTLC